MDVLVFEPNKKDAEAIASVFNVLLQGSTLIPAKNCAETLGLIEQRSPQLVILDAYLPGTDCFDLIRDIRLFSNVAVIVLDGEQNDNSLIRAFELGADEYLVKPFKPLELLVRAKAVVRRSCGTDDSESLKTGLLRLDSLLHRVEIGNKQISLTRTENTILRHLMKNVGRIVSHSSLARELWGDSYPEASATLRTYIERLRKKLGDDPKQPSLIFTETGLGYRLVKLP